MAGAEPPLSRVGPLLHKAMCCLRCGGFAAFRPEGAGPVGYGRAVSRLVNLDHADILGYYSRTLEEFGGATSTLTAYLLRDSLACTLAQKQRLGSRAAAYRKLGATLLGFPTQSKDRPQRFRPDRPAPTWPCSYSRGCPLGHGSASLPMLDSLAEARARDKSTWREADGLARDQEAAQLALAAAGAGARRATTAAVRELLARRAEARAARDFATVTDVRDELNRRGVVVHDKLNRWVAADGRSGAVEPFSVHAPPGWRGGRAAGSDSGAEP